MSSGRISSAHGPATAPAGRAVETIPSVAAAPQEFEVLGRLGSGSYGTVYSVRMRATGIEKAVKVIPLAADRETARRELRSLALVKNLRHPFLLATDDYWVADDHLHVLTELADGTLRTHLSGTRASGARGAPVGELLRLVAEAAEGLDFLHARSVTHRDVKPDNILVQHGHAKVADYGLAREHEQAEASMSFAGTPVYMAPEVWGGRGGPRSDLYSLAVVYAELRQGYPPLRPRPLLEMMIAHQEGAFEFSGCLPREERAVLRRALARSPKDRYPTCTAFSAHLARVVGRMPAG